MNKYKALKNQAFACGEFSIVPIRGQDRYDIMKWRNEQQYHLRQNEVLTKEKQDFYFNTIIAKLFEEDKPEQVLFSYLKDGKCIGYGGLVHINWIDRHAEVSFIMKTSLEEEFFGFNWTKFLNLIEQVATELGLHKIFTYAFDLRPHLYSALESNNYRREAILKEHCFFEGKYIDVLIHSKIFERTSLRRINKKDIDITFQWVNDPNIRSFSFNKDNVERKSHKQWFYSKLNSTDCEYYILDFNGEPAGSIRFDIDAMNEAKINYLIDPKFTGRGLGTEILKKGITLIKDNRPDIKKVFGYVLESNRASVRIFEKLNFDLIEENGVELKYEKEIR